MFNTLNFISWNVRGLNHPVKRGRVFSHIKHLKANVVFLQETHIRNSDNSRLMMKWKGQHFHSSFQAKARGVSILIDQKVPLEVHSKISDSNGRYIIITGKLYNTLVALVNVYAPNTDDPEFFERIFSLLPDLNLYSLILGGDFNCWLDPVLDRSSIIPRLPTRSASLIHSFMVNYGILDIWRFMHPKERDYSFFSSVHHTFTRIDYFLIDNKLINQVQVCEYQSILISDHAPVKLSISFPETPQYKQWRFDSTLLSDDDFVKYMEKHITFFFNTNLTPGISVMVVWDAMKAYLRGQIISYTANLKRRLTKERLELSKKIKELDQMYAHSKNLETYKE